MNNNTKARFHAKTKEDRRQDASMGYPVATMRKSRIAKVGASKRTT